MTTTHDWLPEQARRVRALREAHRLLSDGMYRPPIEHLLRLAVYICNGNQQR